MPGSVPCLISLYPPTALPGRSCYCLQFTDRLRGMKSRANTGCERWCLTPVRVLVPCPTPTDSQSQAELGCEREGPRGRAARLAPRVQLTLSPATPRPCAQKRGRREPEGGCSLSPAFQDRDFLENEQFFLETLKKASYNMTSHSA